MIPAGVVAGGAVAAAPRAAAPAAVPAAAPAVDAGAAAAAAEPDLAGDIRFSTPSGTFQNQLSVTLSTTVSGAQIRYTTDGTVPTAASPLYGTAAVQITRTTQLRAQAFVDGAASGLPGTALYVARGAVTTSHDLPVVVMDAYGKGKPGDAYSDVSYMEMRPTGGSTSVAAAPSLVSRAGFHLRGQSSRMFAKVPYRLELRGSDDKDADLPVLGMPADSDWVLRGPFADKSLIRDALVYDLGREMGLKAPRYAFFELYLNLDAQPLAADDYQGVYMMVETIKNSKQRLDLKKLKAADLTEPNVTGGYIFKFEWLAAEEPTLACQGADATCWHYLELADPSSPAPEQKAWITQYLQRFHTMLHSGDITDPGTGYAAYIDLRSWVDQMIVYELSRNMDAYLRSAWFHKDRGTKIFAGPLWDYDLTFGVGGSFNNNQTSGWQYQQGRTPVANDWFQILIKDPAFLNAVKARWQELRRGVLSNDRIADRITALSTPLTNAAARNFQKWPNLTTSMIGPFTTQTAGTYSGQLAAMRDWIFQRAAWLDSTSGWGGPVTPTPTPTTPSPTPTTPSPTPTTPSPTPTTPSPTVGGKTCTAAYKVISQWQGGFQGEIAITAGSAAITGWRVAWTFAGGQSLLQTWNATVTSNGSATTATNLSWNGSLAAGASTAFGFTANWSGSNPVPAVSCTAS